VKSGDTFTHYEIVAQIGVGGMGEVFSARDTRLDRQVAIKVLPAELAADPERLARFRREAKVLASLNHTNIAAIHGLEEQDGRICLAMELAPGETLAERINRGPVPLEEVLAIAVQIAAGLEEAHAKGIVHRDLKPANVKLGLDGQIKILDFGLARAYHGDGEEAADPSTSPTLTAAMTQAGVILGTAAYMSPEQARGLTVDSRSDIWAFGVTLWELLTGRKLFAGATVTDTLAMILRSDPAWDTLPDGLPPSLRRLLQRCLQRHQRQRLHHMADVRIVLEEIAQDGISAYEPAEGSLVSLTAAGARRARAGWLAAAVMTLVGLVLGWQMTHRETPPLAEPVRFDLTLPDDTWLSGSMLLLAVSPQGDALVVSLRTDDGHQLFLRRLAEPEFVPIPGTQGAQNPFFSPDGRWLSFTSNRHLQKVALDGSGSPTAICETGWGAGTWTRDDRIVFNDNYAAGLSIVSASGGQPQTLTTPDADHNELGHWWPQVLPGDEWVIYSGYSSPIENARIMAVSLKTGEQRQLIEGGTFARWAPTGHLVFVRAGKLMAAPFDLDKVVVTGKAEAVLDDVNLDDGEGFSSLGFGANGTLAYAPASVINAPRQLFWLDLKGNLTPLNMPARRYSKPVLSPDGRRIAVTVEENHNADIWIQDLQRGTFSRFTFAASSDRSPIWTADSHSVIYNGEAPQYTIYERPADGSRDTRLLLKLPEDTVPSSVSPDGRWLVYTHNKNSTRNDIWLLPLTEGSEPRLFLQTDFDESDGMVSPDGHWLAYRSNESGRSEIYAVPFPGGGARLQISLAGGRLPVWSPQGDVLYFLSKSALMSASIDQNHSTATELVVERPELLCREVGAGVDPDEVTFSPAPDGQRFLVVQTPDETRPRTLRVVLNWFTELER